MTRPSPALSDGGGVTSWVSYARPFAVRRRFYRQRRDELNYLDKYQNIQWERYDCAFQSIAWLWAEFREAGLIPISRPLPTSQTSEN